MYSNDKRVVVTLDAGGTNFVFGAIRANEFIIEPIVLPSNADDLDRCLGALERGFRMVLEKLPERPVAISFAFPGPADYPNGIIGDLPNFPSFRGGVALGSFLMERFRIPVFINNDGNLFAYGEALAGLLPEVNARLEKAGTPRRYRNLLGATLGTGFGGGVVINGELLVGDNSSGGDLWCFRNRKYPDYIAEESVSIRAVKRVYAELTGNRDHGLEPKDICEIADGSREGDRRAALRTFEELGEIAGDVLAQAVTIVDGLIVIGGGLCGAAEHIMPSIVREMNSEIGTFAGDRFDRIQQHVYNLDDPEQMAAFIKGTPGKVTIPGTTTQIDYDPVRRIGIAVSKLGASRAISLGAYAFALTRLDGPSKCK